MLVLCSDDQTVVVLESVQGLDDVGAETDLVLRDCDDGDEHAGYGLMLLLVVHHKLEAYCCSFEKAVPRKWG